VNHPKTEDWQLNDPGEKFRFLKSGTPLCQKFGDTQTFYWIKSGFDKKKPNQGAWRLAKRII
ncbi:MAG TPA: hypothetical protein QGG93_12210, partial [Verrucomicrobiota bacterium]|nr:hypothetical protein [Verrucomicrobiota bacterium]